MATKSFLYYSGKVINYKMASIGALIMGVIVGYINIDHGVGPAGIAAAKQATYTFFMGGVLLRILEFIAIRIENPYLAIGTAVIFTTLLTVSLVYGVHSLKGTPKPFESTIPTMLTAPLGLFYVATRYRRKKLGFTRSEYWLNR